MKTATKTLDPTPLTTSSKGEALLDSFTQWRLPCKADLPADSNVLSNSKLLEILLENSPVGVCMSDQDLRITLCNRRFKELLELPADLFDNRSLTLAELFQFNAQRGEYGPGDIQMLVDDRMARARECIAHVYERERPNGTVLEVRGLPIKEGGFVSIYTDVTEQRRKTRQLEAIVDHFPGGLCLFDKNLEMVQHNENLIQMLDYPRHLFGDKGPSLEQLFQLNAERGEYGPGDIAEIVKQRMDRLKEPRAHEYRRKRPDGTVLEVRGAPVDGGGFITTYVDVTAECQSQELIAHMAMHDSLTGLPNRALLMDRLRGAVASAKRGQPMALHYLDLDNFKPVNDNYGHAAGDKLLQQVADRLRAGTRETDTIARLGGDEFVVIQTGISKGDDATILAQRLIDDLGKPFPIEGTQVKIGVSVGIAMAPLNSSSPDELLRLADHALYRSKSQGRHQFCFSATD
ncbi:MAG: PAS-domain containing protein [Pseudomonadota bacterium]